MKNTIVNVFLFIFVVLIFGYIAFLTIFPMILENKFDRPTFKKHITDITALNLDFSTVDAYTTNNLGIGFKLKDVNLTFSDEKPFLKSPMVDIEISALPLLIRTVKFNKVVVTSPEIDLLTLPTKEYKMTDYLNTNYKISNFLIEYPTLSKFKFDMSSIVLKNYKTTVSNLATNQNEVQTGAEQVIPKSIVVDYLKNYTTNADKKTVLNVK